MGENFFYLPPLAVLKYHKFLQVKAQYDMKEVVQSNLSFTPGPDFMDKIIMFGKSTDFLYNGDEADVDMMVEYNTLMNTVNKAESARFMGEFTKVVNWSLQSKET